MANAVLVGTSLIPTVHELCQSLGRVSTSGSRVKSMSNYSRARFGGLSGASSEEIAALSVLQKQRNLRWRSLTVTNAATKIKSPVEADWKTKRDVLLKAKVRSVTPKEALALQQEQGYTIIDVRPDNEFKEAHPAGAINVQVYRVIKEWTLWDIARRVAFAFFGIFQGTEENPDFLKDFYAELSEKDSLIILACSIGGSLKPSLASNDGTESRSLIAAYLLTLDGYTNVVHVEGGLRQWFKQDLPAEEEVDA